MQYPLTAIAICFSALFLVQSGCGSHSPDKKPTPSVSSSTNAAAPVAGSENREIESDDAESVATAGEESAGESTSPTDAQTTASKLTKSTPREVQKSVTLSGKPPAKDDTLITYYAHDPDTLNAITANDSVSDAFHRLVYETLAERRFDDPDVMQPVLAESWEFDPEKLEYTIHLRKGVKWHPATLPNGTELPAKELTARDVKFTFDCILNKNIEAAHIRSYYEDPDAKDDSERSKIKVSLVPGDKYTVKVKWKKPYFLMDEFTLAGQYIIPEHIYSVDENGEPISFDVSSQEFAKGFNNHWANTKAFGTGPMVLKEWTKDQQTVFERNPDYWGEPFYFSQLIYRNISNTNTALQQVLQNNLDWASIPEKDLYVQSKTHPNVVSGKVELNEFYYPAYRYMGYNLNRDFFKDKRVRWAISHAVPVDQIINKVFHGLAVRATGPFLPGSPTNDSSLPAVEYDLDKSKKLLDEAGWTDSNGDGVRDKMIDGQRVDAKFDLMIFADAPSYQTIAEVIKENCRKIGVKVQISPAKWALMLQKLKKKEFDATILGWFLSWKQDPFQIWHGSQADTPDSSNHVSYKNPEVDRLIEELRVTLDPDQQVKLYQQIHRLIHEDQPYTFLFSEQMTAGKHQRLQDVKFYKLRPCINSAEWSASSARVLGQ
jgi:peptide/nickel transport system substrate-binding protein